MSFQKSLEDCKYLLRLPWLDTSHLREKSLVIKANSGLGNRIGSLISALAVAEKFCLKPHVDWSDPCYSNGENAFSKFFDLKRFDRADLHEGTSGLWPNFWNGRIQNTVDAVESELKLGYRDRYFGLEKLAYHAGPEKTLVYWGYQFERRSLIRLGIFTSARTLFHRHLRPSTELQKQLETLPSLSNTLGLHIRATDLNTDYVVEEFIDAARIRKFERILLCTDNVRIVDRLSKEFGNELLVLEKWFPPDGSAIHLTKSKNVDRVDAGLDALRDLYALSRCREIIGTNGSTFSAMAANVFSERAKKLRLIGKIT